MAAQKMTNSAAKRSSKILEFVARIAVGALFVICGCNGFLGFLPAPRIEGLAGQFFEALDQSHYFFVISAFQIVGGVFLILHCQGKVILLSP